MGQEFRDIHRDWLQQKEEREKDDTIATEVPAAEVATPVALVPQDLPLAAIDIQIPPSILQDIESRSVLHDVQPSSENFVNVNVPAGTISSPTLTISTISDLTPTELDEGIEGQPTVRHDTFYFEDGNVEIVCGDAVFRVHSTVISFSSPKLRDILSPSAILHAPTPEGRPRVTIPESAEDFGMLLKMIYTPGSVSSRLSVSSVN